MLFAQKTCTSMYFLMIEGLHREKRHVTSDGLQDSPLGGMLLFQCNNDLKLLDLKNLSVFYKDVLAVWQ